jgi:hypothetical protein
LDDSHAITKGLPHFGDEVEKISSAFVIVRLAMRSTRSVVSRSMEGAEHDIDGEQCGTNQERLVGERLLKRLGRSLETAVDRGRHAKAGDPVVDRRRRVDLRSTCLSPISSEET